jgi:hypothetical protein
MDGLVDGVMQTVVDETVTVSAVASLSTGTVLDGDVDGLYTVFVSHKRDTADSTLEMEINADSTAANYGYRGISMTGSGANISSTAAKVRLGTVTSAYPNSFSILFFMSKQGKSRLLNGYNINRVSGTTIEALEVVTSAYNITNSNITNLNFVPSAGNIGVGARVVVLRRNDFSTGKTAKVRANQIDGSFGRVAEVVTGSGSSTFSISTLDGNRDVIYFMDWELKTTGASSGLFLQINSDTGTNYGKRTFAGTTGSSSTSDTSWAIAPSSLPSVGSGFIYAPTGGVRYGFFFDHGGCRVTACSYNETSTNITAMNGGISGNDFTAGSRVNLYALRPNG